MTHVATAPHEVRGHLLWNDHGCSPYWQLRKLVFAADGGGTYEIEIDGELLTVSLGYDEEGISSRPQDDVDRIYAYNVFWQTEDGLKFGGSFKPRFEPEEFRQYQPSKSFYEREQISVPKDLSNHRCVEIAVQDIERISCKPSESKPTSRFPMRINPLKWSPHDHESRPMPPPSLRG